jgi:hypothetical protein
MPDVLQFHKSFSFFFLVVKGPAADATDNDEDEDDYFLSFS